MSEQDRQWLEQLQEIILGRPIVRETPAERQARTVQAVQDLQYRVQTRRDHDRLDRSGPGPDG